MFARENRRPGRGGGDDSAQSTSNRAAQVPVSSQGIDSTDGGANSHACGAKGTRQEGGAGNAFLAVTVGGPVKLTEGGAGKSTARTGAGKSAQGTSNQLEPSLSPIGGLDGYDHSSRGSMGGTGEEGQNVRGSEGGVWYQSGRGRNVRSPCGSDPEISQLTHWDAAGSSGSEERRGITGRPKSEMGARQGRQRIAPSNRTPPGRYFVSGLGLGKRNGGGGHGSRVFTPTVRQRSRSANSGRAGEGLDYFSYTLEERRFYAQLSGADQRKVDTGAESISNLMGDASVYRLAEQGQSDAASATSSGSVRRYVDCYESLDECEMSVQAMEPMEEPVSLRGQAAGGSNGGGTSASPESAVQSAMDAHPVQDSASSVATLVKGEVSDLGSIGKTEKPCAQSGAPEPLVPLEGVVEAAVPHDANTEREVQGLVTESAGARLQELPPRDGTVLSVSCRSPTVRDSKTSHRPARLGTIHPVSAMMSRQSIRISQGGRTGGFISQGGSLVRGQASQAPASQAWTPTGSRHLEGEAAQRAWAKPEAGAGGTQFGRGGQGFSRVETVSSCEAVSDRTQPRHGALPAGPVRRHRFTFVDSPIGGSGSVSDHGLALTSSMDQSSRPLGETRTSFSRTSQSRSSLHEVITSCRQAEEGGVPECANSALVPDPGVGVSGDGVSRGAGGSAQKGAKPPEFLEGGGSGGATSKGAKPQHFSGGSGGAASIGAQPQQFSGGSGGAASNGAQPQNFPGWVQHVKEFQGAGAHNVTAGVNWDGTQRGAAPSRDFSEGGGNGGNGGSVQKGAKPPKFLEGGGSGGAASKGAKPQHFSGGSGGAASIGARVVTVGHELQDYQTPSKGRYLRYNTKNLRYGKALVTLPLDSPEKVSERACWRARNLDRAGTTEAFSVSGAASETMSYQAESKGAQPQRYSEDNPRSRWKGHSFSKGDFRDLQAVKSYYQNVMEEGDNVTPSMDVEGSSFNIETGDLEPDGFMSKFSAAEVNDQLHHVIERERSRSVKEEKDNAGLQPNGNEWERVRKPVVSEHDDALGAEYYDVSTWKDRQPGELQFEQPLRATEAEKFRAVKTLHDHYACTEPQGDARERFRRDVADKVWGYTILCLRNLNTVGERMFAESRTEWNIDALGKRFVMERVQNMRISCLRLIVGNEDPTLLEELVLDWLNVEVERGMNDGENSWRVERKISDRKSCRMEGIVDDVTAGVLSYTEDCVNVGIHDDDVVSYLVPLITHMIVSLFESVEIEGLLETSVISDCVETARRCKLGPWSWCFDCEHQSTGYRRKVSQSREEARGTCAGLGAGDEVALEKLCDELQIGIAHSEYTDQDANVLRMRVARGMVTVAQAEIWVRASRSRWQQDQETADERARMAAKAAQQQNLTSTQSSMAPGGRWSGMQGQSRCVNCECATDRQGLKLCSSCFNDDDVPLTGQVNDQAYDQDLPSHLEYRVLGTHLYNKVVENLLARGGNCVDMSGSVTGIILEWAQRSRIAREDALERELTSSEESFSAVVEQTMESIAQKEHIRELERKAAERERLAGEAAERERLANYSSRKGPPSVASEISSADRIREAQAKLEMATMRRGGAATTRTKDEDEETCPDFSSGDSEVDPEDVEDEKGFTEAHYREFDEFLDFSWLDARVTEYTEPAGKTPPSPARQQPTETPEELIRRGLASITSLEAGEMSVLAAAVETALNPTQRAVDATSVGVPVAVAKAGLGAEGGATVLDKPEEAQEGEGAAALIMELIDVQSEKEAMRIVVEGLRTDLAEADRVKVQREQELENEKEQSRRVLEEAEIKIKELRDATKVLEEKVSSGGGGGDPDGGDDGDSRSLRKKEDDKQTDCITSFMDDMAAVFTAQKEAEATKRETDGLAIVGVGVGMDGKELKDCQTKSKALEVQIRNLEADKRSLAAKYFKLISGESSGRYEDASKMDSVGPGSYGAPMDADVLGDASNAVREQLIETARLLAENHRSELAIVGVWCMYLAKLNDNFSLSRIDDIRDKEKAWYFGGEVYASEKHDVLREPYVEECAKLFAMLKVMFPEVAEVARTPTEYTTHDGETIEVCAGQGKWNGVALYQRTCVPHGIVSVDLKRTFETMFAKCATLFKTMGTKDAIATIGAQIFPARRLGVQVRYAETVAKIYVILASSPAGGAVYGLELAEWKTAAECPRDRCDPEDLLEGGLAIFFMKIESIRKKLDTEGSPDRRATPAEKAVAEEFMSACKQVSSPEKFARAFAMHRGEAPKKKGGRSEKLCWAFAEGNCEYGAKCRFTHKLPDKGSAAVATAAKTEGNAPPDNTTMSSIKCTAPGCSANVLQRIVDVFAKKGGGVKPTHCLGCWQEIRKAKKSARKEAANVAAEANVGSEGGEKKGPKRDGDWNCACGFMVFGSRKDATCPKCNTVKPGTAKAAIVEKTDGGGGAESTWDP